MDHLTRLDIAAFAQNKVAAMTLPGAALGAVLGNAKSAPGYQGGDTARGAMIGAGTGLGADLGAGVGATGGHLIGKLLASLLAKKLHAPEGAAKGLQIMGGVGGGAVGGVTGGVTGGVKGYHLSKNYLNHALPHLNDAEWAKQPPFDPPKAASMKNLDRLIFAESTIAKRQAIKTASTKAAIAGLVILMRDKAAGRNKSAGGITAGLGTLAEGVAKKFTGSALMSGGKTLASAGGHMISHPVGVGASLGAVGGGYMGADADNSWGQTFRNMGLGAAAGATAGHFGGAAAGRGLQNLGGKLSFPSFASSGSGLRGIGDRLINQGNAALGSAASAGVGQGGATGWLNRTVGGASNGIGAAGRAVGQAPQIATDAMVGRRNIPWTLGGVAGGVATGLAGANRAGQEGATEGVAQMTDQYQQMPFMQRLMLAMNPDALTERLPPAMQQRLMQIRQMGARA